MVVRTFFFQKRGFKGEKSDPVQKNTESDLFQSQF